MQPCPRGDTALLLFSRGSSYNSIVDNQGGEALDHRHRVRPRSRRRRVIEAKEKALAAVAAAQEKKGHNLTVIDLEGECSYTDFLVIISAGSERQTSAIAEAITDNLRRECGLRPLFREGQGGWILLDYGDVIIHVFIDDTRAFYDLDRLWPKAPRVPVPVRDDAVGADPIPAAFAARRRRP